MGIPTQMREAWGEKRRSFFIPSPSEEQRILDSNTSIQEGVREGLKSASVTCVASAVPTVSFLFIS
ncbi:hypothetical protein QJS04_geneDACA002607 [Acorus gramineus]|uniref:Uncharacterized protein n=1 Tax=Acorus gramineus TaxID=55184 RepID=A0AAV9ASN1_ACOGR|nr:hypothetical protein QJS04_geneDACA002607 [Acorus gramineus]